MSEPVAITIHAEIERSSYWPGETLNAFVDIESLSSDTELLELQVYCIGTERLDSLWIRSKTTTAKSSAPAGERVFLQTATATLLSKARLEPRSPRRYEVQVALPEVLPPSHRGTAVRWIYQLVATAKYTKASKEASPVIIRQPFRIWPGGERGKTTIPQVTFTASDTVTDCRIRWREVTPPRVAAAAEGPLMQSVPAWTLGIMSSAASRGAVEGWAFAGTGGAFCETADTALGLPPEVAPLPPEDDSLAEGRSVETGLLNGNGQGHGSSKQIPPAFDSQPEAPQPSASFALGRTYNICLGETPLVRFAPQAAPGGHELGGPVAGALLLVQDARERDAAAGASDSAASDSAASQWRCMQVSVSLEEEEVVNKQCVSSATGAAQGVIRKVHAEYEEVCLNLHETHFLFSLPPDAQVRGGMGCYSFSSEAVDVRWVLRFEFVAVLSQRGARAPEVAARGKPGSAAFK
eukprot:gene15398-18218_t